MPSRLKPFIEQGCLLQVTAGAVAGSFGPAAQAIAHDLLQQGLVSILATDAHNIDYRPPIISDGLQCAAQLIGDTRAEALVLQTPWQIAQGHFQ